ncbi:MAG: CsgG/HfaB family protein [Cetobacterium sp.]
MKKLLVLISVLGIMGCSGAEKNGVGQKMEGMRSYNTTAQIVPKRNIMVSNFYNNTRYGKGKFMGFGTEVISTEFSKTERFIVLERDEKYLNAIQKEISFMENVAERGSKVAKKMKLDEAEFAVFGTLTSFGVQEIAKSTLVSTGVTQVVRATVDIKVMELTTGRTWSETGEFQSDENSRTVLAVGSGNSYNQNSEERAVRGAIVDAMNKAIKRIDNTPWNAAGKIVGNRVYIMGVGKQSNLKVGTSVDIYSKGEAIYLDDEFLGYSEEKIGTGIIENYLTGGKEGSIASYNGKPFNNKEVIIRLSETKRK